VIDEIEIKSNACRNRLDKLGEPRAPVAEQRLYLLYTVNFETAFPQTPSREKSAPLFRLNPCRQLCRF
jgi:hypothetical protein